MKQNKPYTLLTIRHKSTGMPGNWAYLTENVRNNGGLDNHIKDVERLYDVKVTGITHYTEGVA